MAPVKGTYESRIFEGRVMLPEEQDVWPELAQKLPPEDAESPPDMD
jgi:hypothetical protein